MDKLISSLLVLVVVAELALIGVAVSPCLIYAEKYVGTGQACMPAETRDAIAALLAGLLATVVALYKGPKS